MGRGLRGFTFARLADGMLIARVILGIAEGPLFSLKTRFISDNFSAQEIGKPNAVTALGVSLGLAVGFPLVTG